MTTTETDHDPDTGVPRPQTGDGFSFGYDRAGTCNVVNYSSDGVRLAWVVPATLDRVAHQLDRIAAEFPVTDPTIDRGPNGHRIRRGVLAHLAAAIRYNLAREAEQQAQADTPAAEPGPVATLGRLDSHTMEVTPSPAMLAWMSAVAGALVGLQSVDQLPEDEQARRAIRAGHRPDALASYPECPSASAAGRPDRCGIFSHPPRCLTGSCSERVPDPELERLLDEEEAIATRSLIWPPGTLAARRPLSGDITTARIELVFPTGRPITGALSASLPFRLVVREALAHVEFGTVLWLNVRPLDGTPIERIRAVVCLANGFTYPLPLHLHGPTGDNPGSGPLVAVAGLVAIEVFTINIQGEESRA